MKTTIKPAALVNAALLAFACASAAGAAGSATAQASSSNATSADEQLARGAYLARVGDCAACHTASPSRPFAGGLPLHTPFGTLFSTNITPDATTGIGAYTYDDFAHAVREGVTRDGHRLYPAMPYPSYAKVDDADMHALYRYFTHGVKPVAQTNHAQQLSFPFNIRPLMAAWDWMYSPHGAYRADPQQSVEWNRGAYLVQGLAHCGACHTPHNMLGAESAFDGNNNDTFLSGYSLAGWHAPDLRHQHDGGAPGVSKDALVAYLRSGRQADGAAFGPMTEVIDDSLQYLHDDDLNAIATYLTSAPLRTAKSDATPVAAATPQTADLVAVQLRAGHVGSAGAKVYLDNCSACHRTDGSGAMPTFPRLANSAVVADTDPSSLIHIVLTGSHMPSTRNAPTPLAMPDFGWRLNDQQVADVLTFVRSSWGNHASPVTADDVSKVRQITQAASK